MEEQKKLLIYLASVEVLHRLYLSGKIDVEILKRLNKRNAEVSGCVVIDFIKYD